MSNKEKVLILKSEFVFLLFLFKTHLDLNLCDFWFLILFFIFYLFKIDKLIFLNLNADVEFFNAKIKFLLLF